ncbi:DUF4123 domain-containing protein [Citrobacter farmeri]|uniref:DUF4123 domain-containing protein n=1 Tax=Citrobacter amalonaticus TaxID=35703 RepID=UPI001D051B2D|nr:DUF4123 domain-containing protein [Citrobacter amalonaticus]
MVKHWLNRNKKHNVFVLFESGALTDEMRQLVMKHYEDRCTPLYHLPELKAVAPYGPWLACIEEEKELTDILIKKLPVAGIIFSELPLLHLAPRLAIGCTAKTPDKRKVLLRFYTPRVLKKLAARSDMGWHSLLFSPIESWWVQEDSQWQRLTIPFSEVRDFVGRALTLDEPLWREIAGREDVSVLLREWRTMKVSNHFPPCAQRHMVEKALSKARQVGLTNPLDQKIYAISYLNGKKDYLGSAEFQTVLERVKRNEISLSDLGSE